MSHLWQTLGGTLGVGGTHRQNLPPGWVVEALLGALPPPDASCLGAQPTCSMTLHSHRPPRGREKREVRPGASFFNSLQQTPSPDSQLQGHLPHLP